MNGDTRGSLNREISRDESEVISKDGFDVLLLEQAVHM